MRITVRRERVPHLLAAAALAVAGLFLVSMFASTEGHFVPQVADLYLTCQYAKAFAEGHAFHYNAGEGPSTGATSLLHTAVLGLAHAAGFRGEGLVAFAIALGIALYVASVLVAFRAGQAWCDTGVAALAGALVAFGGPVVWGFLYGADIALFLFFALLLVHRYTRAWVEARPASHWAGAGVLLALARPEGLLIGAMLAAAWSASRRAPARAHVAAWAPVAAGAAVLLLQRILTGAWVGSSVADKSLLANYGLAATVGVVAEYALDVVRGLLLGFYPSHAPVGFARGWAPLMFPPLGLVLAGAALVAAPPLLRRALAAWLAAAGLTILAVSPNTFAGVHFNRYVLWAFPGLLVLVAAGVRATAARLAAGNAAVERRTFLLLGGALVVLGLLATARFGVLYGEMAGQLHGRDVQAARWIRAQLPPGVAILGAATSVEYLTGHRNLNLHGVTTPAFFGNRTAERELGVLESLARLPEAERPPYLLSSAAVQAGSETLRVIADGPPVYRTLTLGDELELYRTRYDALDRARAPARPEALGAVAALTLSDQLNVGDLHDESAHSYRHRSALGSLRIGGAARVEAYDEAGPAVADGGRAIIGEEEFTVRTVPGRELVIVMRTAPHVAVVPARPMGGVPEPLEFGEMSLTLRVGDREALRTTFRPREGWDDIVLRVPAAAVTESRSRLGLRGQYAAFRYWFYQ